MLLSFLFCYLLCDPPGASSNSKTPSHFLSSQMCWRREWDLNPRGPKGHRLTGEPIPDMGPRARQTARYQAPESRPTRPDPLTNYFSPLENNNRAPQDHSNSRRGSREDRKRMTRVAMGAGQPTTLDGRMAVPAPGGRLPYETLTMGSVLRRVFLSHGGTRYRVNVPVVR